MASINRPSYLGWVWLGGAAMLAVILSLLTVLAPTLIIYLLALIAGTALVWWATNPGPWWARIVGFLLLGSLVLGQGFSNITLGVGSARLPLTELGIAVILIYFLLTLRWAELLGGSLGWMVLVLALVPLVIHLPFDVAEFGIVALRDSSHYVDLWAFFIGTGYAIKLSQGKLTENVWARFMFTAALLASLYVLTYSARAQIGALSPMARGYQQFLPIVGYYNMVNVAAFSVIMLALALSRRQVWPGLDERRPWIITFAILSGLGLLITQTRALFVAFVLVMLILLALGWVRPVLWFLASALFALVCFEFANAYGLRVSGKLASISFETFYDMLISITGQGDLRGAAHGTHQRLDWWGKLLQESVETPQRFWLGRGFGQALTDFYAPGTAGQVIVREPHNSFLSVYARVGMIFFGLWMILKGRIYWALFSAYRASGEKGPYGGFFLWVILFLVVNDVRALVEPVYEFPYGAVPIYFLSGFSLVWAQHLAKQRRLAL